MSCVPHAPAVLDIHLHASSAPATTRERWLRRDVRLLRLKAH